MQIPGLFQLYTLVFVSASLIVASGYVVAEDEEGVAPVARTVYVKMEPAFVTNYGEPVTRKMKYVKAEISLRVSSPDAEQAVLRHMPNLRNEIVFLLSSQSAESMAAGQAQEMVRKDALKAVNKVLRDEDETATVDDLLFTNFVVQR
ncbi:MAG: flagellar basal body-associated protein FliL [Proteobacteria bacterium]|nr:MAG: flagellar basal body-associated protein FliL [Pseudomonadota bacterium]